MNGQANASAKSKEVQHHPQANAQLHHICFCPNRTRLRIEDRDNVFSDIHFRIRLLVKRNKYGKAEAAIDKLTKLQYHLAVGVNKKSP